MAAIGVDLHPDPPADAEGRVDVMHWVPDEDWMRRYACVVKEAGLLDEDVDGDVRQFGPGGDDA